MLHGLYDFHITAALCLEPMSDNDALQAPPPAPVHDGLLSRRQLSSRTRRNQYDAAGACYPSAVARFSSGGVSI